MKTIDGGLAFTIDWGTDGGLTVRDFFAAAAMQAIVSRERRNVQFDDAAIIAYGCADAMLAERRNPAVQQPSSLTDVRANAMPADAHSVLLTLVPEIERRLAALEGKE